MSDKKAIADKGTPRGFTRKLPKGRSVFVGCDDKGSFYIQFISPRKKGQTEPAAQHNMFKKGGKDFCATTICISEGALKAIAELSQKNFTHTYKVIYKFDGDVSPQQWVVVDPKP